MMARAGLLTPLFASLVLTAVSGCSIYKAATLPEHRNLTVLSAGTPRLHVIAELGIPASTQNENGYKRDLFMFRQGPPPAVKNGRVVFHTAADVLTAGLWEIAGTPIEFLAEGKPMSLEVTYDEHDRVRSIVYLENRPPLPVVATPASPPPAAPVAADGEWTGTASLENGPSLLAPEAPPPETGSPSSVTGASRAK